MRQRATSYADHGDFSMPQEEIRTRLMSDNLELDHSCPVISLPMGKPGHLIRRNTLQKQPLEISPLKKAMMALDQDSSSKIISSSGSKYHDRMSGMRKRLTEKSLNNVTVENRSEFRLQAIRENSRMLVQKFE
jgi:hypothetical protein